MQDRFDRTLARLTDGRPDCKMLLAVSGGIDSMTMADLFLHRALRLPLAVAHFNFHLRGADSDGDSGAHDGTNACTNAGANAGPYS